MTIYPYSTPALLALLAKFVILYFSRRAEVQGARARIFRFALVLSILLNLAELTILQRPFENSAYYGGIAYYAISTLLLIPIVQLAVFISFDGRNSFWLSVLIAVVCVYGVALTLVLIFDTSLLITGALDLGGYSVVAVRGPFYGSYELFLVLSLALTLILPAFGIRSSCSGIARNRCKLWLLAASPLVFLVLAITVLLHFEIYRFNATVTTPLLITTLMAAIGYAIQSQRIVEIGFFLPWSKARRTKIALYRKLKELGRELRAFDTLDSLLQRVSAILEAPAVLRCGNPIANAGSDEKLLAFPISELSKIKLPLAAGEPGLTGPVQKLMLAHGVGLIVPLLPRTRFRCWLLCGQEVSKRIYSAHDFEALEHLSKKLGGLLLDRMVYSRAANRHRSRSQLRRAVP